jgi:hypothetical protein
VSSSRPQRIEPLVIARHRVSIGGRLRGAAGAVPQGGTLQLLREGDRPRQAALRADGRYFFLDVPAGEYRLQWQWDAGDPRETPPAVAVTVVHPAELAMQLEFDFEVAGADGGGGVVARPGRAPG